MPKKRDLTVKLNKRETMYLSPRGKLFLKDKKTGWAKRSHKSVYR